MLTARACHAAGVCLDKSHTGTRDGVKHLVTTYSLIAMDRIVIT